MKTSVIIPAFNAEHFLAEAIESILHQDADDYELIVINDGSTDRSAEILDTFDKSNLTAVHLPVNCGIGMARNVGLRLAKGEYIAIMDADDIALPHRLSTQAKYLDSHPEIDILGSRTIRIKNSIDDVINRPDHPLNDPEIKARLILLNGTAMVDPTTMMRRNFLDRHKLQYASISLDVDHELWSRCLEAGVTFHSLEDRLLYKRRHQHNVTSLSMAEKAVRKLPLRKRILGMYYPRLTMEELQALASITTPGTKITYNQANLGIQSAGKALAETRSIYGESREMLNRIVARAVQDFQNAFNRTKANQRP